MAANRDVHAEGDRENVSIQRGMRRLRNGASLCALLLTLPPAAAAEPAPSFGQWQPGPHDTCSKRLHDSYSVIGPDGLRYPTWHPPVGDEPAKRERSAHSATSTGETRRHSDLYGWVSRHLGRGRTRQALRGAVRRWPMPPSTSGRRRTPARHPPGGPRRPQGGVGERRDPLQDRRRPPAADRHPLRLPHEDPPGDPLGRRLRQTTSTSSSTPSAAPTTRS